MGRNPPDAGIVCGRGSCASWKPLAALAGGLSDGNCNVSGAGRKGWTGSRFSVSGRGLKNAPAAGLGLVAAVALGPGPAFEMGCGVLAMAATTWGGSGTGETFDGTCVADLVDLSERLKAAGSPTLKDLAAGVGLGFDTVDTGAGAGAGAEACRTGPGAIGICPITGRAVMSGLLAIKCALRSPSYPLVNPPWGE